MAFVVVKSMIATIFKEPVAHTEHDNEALHGEVLEIADILPGGWYRVRTHYGHEGFARAEDFNAEERAVSGWIDAPKKLVKHYMADVLLGPGVRNAPVISLTRACRVIPLGDAENGWRKIKTAGGPEGFIRDIYLEEPVSVYDLSNEANLRENLARTALSYLGTQYRWGGKTPMGIDCAGLCAMALMLNGIVVFNGMVMLDRIEKAPPLHQIPLEETQKGDFIFWRGHVAMRLDGGKFVHSSGSRGGVGINSLNKGDPDYDEGFINGIIGAASVF